MRNLNLGLINVLVLGLIVIGLQSCGKRAFTKGQYEDPNKVILLDDKFNENDMQLMANTLVDSLTEYERIKTADERPIVMIGTVKNRTSEHIDVKLMTDKVRTALIKSGRFRFSDKDARSELEEEYKYQEGSAVNKNTAARRGQQVGVDYIITGSIGSNVQEVGKDKVVYYKVTMNLIDVETNLIDWSEEREVRKVYRKRNVGL